MEDWNWHFVIATYVLRSILTSWMRNCPCKVSWGLRNTCHSNQSIKVIAIYEYLFDCLLSGLDLVHSDRIQNFILTFDHAVDLLCKCRCHEISIFSTEPSRARSPLLWHAMVLSLDALELDAIKTLVPFQCNYGVEKLKRQIKNI